MAMTREELQRLRNGLMEWKSRNSLCFDAYQAQNRYWVTSDLSAGNEMKSRMAFVDTFRVEAVQLSRLFGGTKKMFDALNGDPNAVNALKEAGLYTFAKDVVNTAAVLTPGAKENGIDTGRGFAFDTDEEKKFRKQQFTKPEDLNFLQDHSLTREQRKNLRECRKWIYKHAGETGSVWLGSDGEVREYLDTFMRKPLAVQMGAIYLVNTNKRKNPEPLDLNLADAETSGNSMDPEVFKGRMKRNWLYRHLSASKTRGTHLYWKKLQSSVDLVEKSPRMKEILDFRREEKAAAEKRQSEEPTESERLDSQVRAARQIGKVQDAGKADKALEEIRKAGAELLEVSRKLKELEDDKDLQKNEAFGEYREGLAKELFRKAQAVKDAYENNREGFKFVKYVCEKSGKGAAVSGEVFSANGMRIYGTACAITENFHTVITKADKPEEKLSITNELGKLVQKATGGKISEGKYVGLTDALQGGLVAIGSLVGLVSSTFSLYKDWDTKNLAERAENGLTIAQSAATGVAGASKTVSSIMTNLGGMEKTASAVQTAGQVASKVSLAAKVIGFVKNGYQSIRSWMRRSKAETLTKDAKALNPEDKGVKVDAQMAKKRSKWRAVKFTALTVTAGAGVAAAVVLTAPVSVAAGVVAGTTLAVNKLVENVASRKEKKAEGDKAVDQNLLKTDDTKRRKQERNQNGEKVRTIDIAVDDFKERLQRKAARFEEGSPEQEELKDFVTEDPGSGVRDKMKRMLRDQRAAENGALNAFNYGSRVRILNIENAFRQVFFADDAEKMDELHLRDEQNWLFNSEQREQVRNADLNDPNLTEQGKTQLAAQKKRLTYYDLLKMEGVKMTPSNKRNPAEKFESIMARKQQASMCRK